MIRSVETTWLAWISSRARSDRCLNEPSGTFVPSLRTSSGPRTAEFHSDPPPSGANRRSRLIPSMTAPPLKAPLSRDKPRVSRRFQFGATSSSRGRPGTETRTGNETRRSPMATTTERANRVSTTQVGRSPRRWIPWAAGVVAVAVVAVAGTAVWSGRQAAPEAVAVQRRAVAPAGDERRRAAPGADRAGLDPSGRRWR